MTTAASALRLATSLWLAGLLAFLPAAHGQTGLAFLRLGAAARDAALAEATTALAGASATTNPAALAPTRSAILSHTEWIGDMRHEYGTVTWGLAGGAALALDLRVAHAGQLERRTGPTAAPLGEFGIYEWTAGMVWAQPLGPRLRAGLAARVVRQSIDAQAAAGGAVDLGVVYGDGPWWVGAAARNLGRMNDLGREATDLPEQLGLGAAGVRGPLLLSADVRWTRNADASLHLGGEYQAHPHLVLRAGAQTADTRDVAAGFGVTASAWRLDYAWIPFRGGLGAGHRVSLVWLDPGP